MFPHLKTGLARGICSVGPTSDFPGPLSRPLRTPDNNCLSRKLNFTQTRELVSKEIVVLRRWGRETQILDLSTELIR